MIEHHRGKEGFSKEVKLELAHGTRKEQAVWRARDIGMPGKENCIKRKGSFYRKLIIRYECFIQTPLSRSKPEDQNGSIIYKS